MNHQCEICHEILQQEKSFAKDGASISFYICPLCGAIYVLFVAPRLDGGYGLFCYMGDGVWERVGVAEEVLAA